MKSGIKFQEFNQNDFKDEGKQLKDEQITINIKYENNREIIKTGRQEGILYFTTDYNDKETNKFNSSDIEGKTTFQTVLTEKINKDSEYTHNITCRLWKPIHANLKLFCKLKESLNSDNPGIKIDNYTFNYEKYKISINFCFEQIYIFVKNNYLTFLYSDEQIINIDDEKDSYHLKFNIEFYNYWDTFLIGGKFLNTKIFANYKIKKKELICEIKKEDLIEILPINGGNLFLYSYSSEDSEINKYPNVLNIIVNIKNLQKEDIYVGINKILNKNFQVDSFVPLETNVTNISNLITEDGQYKLGENEYTCYLKKDPDKPLLLLCTGFKKGNYSLDKLINNEIILNNINVKYNFKIQPTKNTEEFVINNEHGAYINFVNPKVIDFTKKHRRSRITIYFLYKGNKSISDIYYNKLTLAPNLENLDCSYYNSYFRCVIDYEYFK